MLAIMIIVATENLCDLFSVVLQPLCIGALNLFFFFFSYTFFQYCIVSAIGGLCCYRIEEAKSIP